MCYAVVEAVTFCQAALSLVLDADQLPDVGTNQPCVEMSKEVVVISDGIVFFDRFARVPYQRTLADLATFEQCVEECLGLLKFVGVSILECQCLSRGVYHYFSSMLPQEFLTRPMEDLLVPFLGNSAQLCVNGLIFLELDESTPVQCVTVVNSWRSESALLEELEAVNVVRLWLSRDGMPSGLVAFLNLLLIMGDSFVPVVPKSGLSLVTLGVNRLRSLVGVVHSYFSLQRGRL